MNIRHLRKSKMIENIGEENYVYLRMFVVISEKKQRRLTIEKPAS